jgi:hypothetical protein
MKYLMSLLLISIYSTSLAQPTSGKWKFYKILSNYISGIPSSTSLDASEGVAVVDSNGVFTRKITAAALGLPTGNVYRLARFTGTNTVTNTTSLVDSAGFYGFGQIEGSGLQNARFNITTQNSTSSSNGLIFKNTNNDLFGNIKNTGSFSFGVTSALNWDEVNTKLTSNSAFQFGTSNDQFLYFITNGSIRTALDGNAFTVNVPVDNTPTSYTGLARGTTAERPSATFSRIRANTDSSGIEYADGSAWQQLASRNWVRSNFGGSATTIYNGDDTLTATRNVNGGGHHLSFGSSGSKVALFTVNSNSRVALFSGITYGTDATNTDADYTVPGNVIIAELNDVLTTGRTLTLPSLATNGQMITLVMRSSIGVNKYSLSSAVLDNATGTTFTTLDWGKTYDFFVTSSLSWILIRKY